MKTIKLKTQDGKTVVTVNGNTTEFSTIHKALKFISKERGLMK